jgi:hypothetical protein
MARKNTKQLPLPTKVPTTTQLVSSFPLSSHLHYPPPHLITHASSFITASIGAQVGISIGLSLIPVAFYLGRSLTHVIIKRRVLRKAASSNSVDMPDSSAAAPNSTPVRQHTFTDHSGQPVTVVPTSSQPATPPADPKAVELKKVEQMAAAEAKKPEVVVVEKKPEEKKEAVVVEEKKPEEKKKDVVVVEEKKPEEKKPEPVVVVVDDKKPVEKKAVVVEEKKPEPVMSALTPDFLKPKPTVVVVEDKKPEEKKAVVVEEKKPETPPAVVVVEMKPETTPAVVAVPEKKPTTPPAVVVVPEVVKPKVDDASKTVTTTITTTTVEEKKPTVTFVEEKKPVPVVAPVVTPVVTPVVAPVVAPVVEIDTFTIPNAVGIFTQYKALRSTTLTLNKQLVADSSGKALFKVSLRFFPSFILGPANPIRRSATTTSSTPPPTPQSSLFAASAAEPRSTPLQFSVQPTSKRARTKTTSRSKSSPTTFLSPLSSTLTPELLARAKSTGPLTAMSTSTRRRRAPLLPSRRVAVLSKSRLAWIC